MAPASILTFLLLFLSAAARHHHAASPTSSNPIQAACKATRYVTVCETTLSQNPALPANPTAKEFIATMINSSETGLKTAEEKAEKILEASVGKDLNRTNAAKNCLMFLSFSERRLAAAARAVGGGALADARAWGSAGLLYQYDCWSALKYVNGTHQVADAMSFILNLTNVTSNALSMITSLQRYGDDTSLWGPPQTERDNYWGDASTGPNNAGVGSQNGVPNDLVPDVTVCESGCKYQTVQAAVDSAPTWSERYVIYIKEGVYKENVKVPYEKTNLVFLGDGMGKTVITGDLNADTVGLSTYNTATVSASGDGFMASNLTISNTAGPDAHQAVAFVSDSDRSILQNVEFLGHQDTLYAHSLRQLYKNCRISGTVDFIFGNSASVFQDSLIFVLPRQLNPSKGEVNTVTAHGRTDPAQSTGFVFYNCVINGSDDYWGYYNQNPAIHKAYLGRPWKEYSRTVFINCVLEKIIRPEGWSLWSGDFALNTLFYGEYKNQGSGADITQRVKWSSQIPEEHLDVYSLQNFIQLGSTAAEISAIQSGCHEPRELKYALGVCLLFLCIYFNFADNF